MPCQNFFLLLLTPTHSSNTYPFPFSINMTDMSSNCNHNSLTSSMMLNCSHSSNDQHIVKLQTSETCDMPSGHMLSPTYETYNMPSSCMVSPGTSGCMMLTCIIPLTLTFPISLPLHSTSCSSSGTTLNCRNLRMYPDLTNHLGHLSHISNIGD